VAEIEFKVEEYAKKNKIILQNSTDLEIKLKSVLNENNYLNESLKQYKDNSIPKNKVIENEINYKKLYEEYTANQNLMKKLEEKVKESAANNNSTRNILFNEIKEIKNKLENLSSEKINLNEEIKTYRKDKEDMLDKINLLNMNLLKKDNEVRDTIEKMENLQNEFNNILIENNIIKDNSEEMKQKMNLLQNEILNKNDEIFRLSNLKIISEKLNNNNESANSLNMKGK
jgi:chromosome segregation ATPase